MRYARSWSIPSVIEPVLIVWTPEGMGPLSNQQLVSNSMNGDQVLRLLGGIAELFTELDDDLIERAGGAVIVVAPDFAQELVARKHRLRMRIKQLVQL